MKKIAIVGVIILVAAVFLRFWWEKGTKAVNPQDAHEKIFVIEKGKTIREIATALKEENLISDQIVFFLYVKQSGKDKDIQAGDYKLSSSMNLQTIVETLRHGTLDIWVTLPEGLRGEEVAQIFKEKFTTYDESWEEAFIANNGYLFPDTYLIPKDGDKNVILTLLKNTFNKKVQEIGIDPNSTDLPGTVTFASLIEREAKNDTEKPIIAGIIQNRLTGRIPLQIDATVQYAKGYDIVRKRWWGSVTTDDYKGVISPYNTYLNIGLPPAPIANPGIASLKAAINPSQTPYYYYLHGTDGNIHYARTIQEHNRNISKYIQ